jgi:probable rRNA maturation factor
MAITFQSQSVSYNLKQKQLLRKWLEALITSEKKETGDINFVFTSDEELLKINIQYLRHNTYTDIITFDSSFDKTISGDIMISIDRVRENADKFKVDAATELHRVMAHGVLHLCGYKDKTPAQSSEMRKQENIALKKLKRFQNNK